MVLIYALALGMSVIIVGYYIAKLITDFICEDIDEE